MVRVTFPTLAPQAHVTDRAAVKIGGARLRELPAIARLQRRAFPPRLAYTLSTLLILWILPWVRMLVARRNGQIAGCIIGDRVWQGGRVINLAVEPDTRRQGIGTGLLLAVERAIPGGDMTLMVQVEIPPRRRSTGRSATRRSPSQPITTDRAGPASGCGKRGMMV